MAEFRRPELLDRSRHRREGFSSTDAELDDWLARYSGQSRRRNVSAVWVVADSDNVVAAYATLSMTGLDISAAPARLASGASDPVPAVLIGRLAVDSRHAGLGLGTALLEYCLAIALSTNEKVACRAVVVNATDEGAFGWWEHLGFHALDPDDPDSQDLYLLTQEFEDVIIRLSEAGSAQG